MAESVYEGFDVWFDMSGVLWSDGRSTPPARLAVGSDAPRSTQRLIVAAGETPRLRRRKAKWLGWEILVPGVQSAWPYSAGDVGYGRALKAMLESHLRPG
jgi:hypothetical protein